MSLEYEDLARAREAITKESGRYIDAEEGMVIARVYGPSLTDTITTHFEHRESIRQELTDIGSDWDHEIGSHQFLRRPLATAGYLAITVSQYLLDNAEASLNNQDTAGFIFYFDVSVGFTETLLAIQSAKSFFLGQNDQDINSSIQKRENYLRDSGEDDETLEEQAEWYLLMHDVDKQCAALLQTNRTGKPLVTKMAEAWSDPDSSFRSYVAGSLWMCPSLLASGADLAANAYDYVYDLSDHLEKADS